MNKCDIIIPTYQNEQYTVDCFESIKKHTKDYRIIWVDNGSKHTAAAEQTLEGVDHIFIKLDSNHGFVGAVNKGLERSDAPFVCLLNNDTLVSPRWLGKLINALDKNPKLGIVGAITAPSGTKFSYDSHHSVSHIEDHGKKIFPSFTNLEDFNKTIERKFNGVLADISFVAFLCAVIKREVINKIGLLDTNYEMGFYDDNDYNLAARKAGYQTKLLYDTCIYHKGRATFNGIQKHEGFDARAALRKNKLYLDKKWGLPKGTKHPEAAILALYPYGALGMDAWHDHGAGMTYAAAKKAGCDVDFIDMKSLVSDENLRDRLNMYKVVAFGLKSSFYPIAMRVISAAKHVGAKVVVGGYHATAAPQELLDNPDIDWVFHGESETTLPKFLEDPESFPREIFGERPLRLDDLPFIDRSIYREPVEDCSGWWYGGKNKNMISVMATRGCPYNCGFCQPLERNHFGSKIRRRSVDSLIEELLMLKKSYNPDCVMIHDDTFLIQPKWIEEFIEKYPKVGIPFWAAGRADGICDRPDLVKSLVKVGWELVSVGFESGSQRILDLMKKETTVEQNIEAAQIIKSTGAKVYGNYILGLPWETKEDIQATAKMADKIAAEMPSWAYFTPYPGCELGEECIQKGWSLLDRNHYDRCPSGHKVKNVDYAYVGSVMGGLRE